MTPALHHRPLALAAAATIALGLATATPAFANVTGVVDVAAGNTLSVRSTPSATGTKVGSLADGASVSIICATTGSSVTGTFGTTSQWDKISTGYVSHAYVSAANVPSCSASSTNGTVDVAAGATLSVRSTPNTTGTKVGSLADGAAITILCKTTGSSVTGTFGTTTRWDKISTGYVSHAYVSSTATVADCTSTTPPPSSTSARVTATVNAAKSMIGVYPYVYAGGNFYGATVGVDDGSGYPSDAYTKGFDCSGLMEYAYYQGAGVQVASTSRLQYSQGQTKGWMVPLAQRQAGDMVFSATNTADQSTIYHVALLMSPSSLVQAASHASGLTTNLSWAPTTGKTMPYVVRPIR